MIYKKTTLPLKGSAILKKLKKSIPKSEIEKNFSHVDIFMLEQDEVLDDSIVIKLLDVSRDNNININSLLYKQNLSFVKAPLVPLC
jgi:hypothetical protein